MTSGTLAFAVPATQARNARAVEVSEDTSQLVLSTTTSILFDTEFTAAYPFVEVLGVTVRGPQSQISNARLDVIFDPRVLSISSLASTVTCGRHSVSQPILDRTDEHGGLLSIKVPDLGYDEAVDMTVALPLTRHALYPNDAVDTARATVVKLIDGRQNEVLAVSTANPDTAPVPGATWGTLVTAVWNSFAVAGRGNAFDYSYPAFIRVTSVGPSAIPRGARLTVRLDARLATVRNVAAYGGDDPANTIEVLRDESNEDGARTVSLTLTEPIPATEALTIAANVAPSHIASGAQDVVFATVSIEGPVPGSPLQRVTGSESAVAVSQSGAPRHAAAFVGRI
ncbi:hypothetical protein [Curtobacterium poinsettiae]|uniref:hypothetical protein n=1 Tax=Curtobacterium poinsettiae TaxID=159612 RepID=UPI002361ED18|nr:hypothetical protein [Curtobacterium flaccumfaciens]MDD1386407.1 hypothetical protein [Curtobacterium flaccumfaciens pv. poinsettiae]